MIVQSRASMYTANNTQTVALNRVDFYSHFLFDEIQFEFVWQIVHKWTLDKVSWLASSVDNSLDK